MLSFLRTSFVLSLWILVTAGTEKGGAPTKARCDITRPFASPYVQAFLQLRTPGRGCSTNVTAQKPQRQVHVIHALVPSLPSSAHRQQVHLRIEPGTSDFPDDDLLSDSGGRADSRRVPLVVVLSSSQPVKWKVELVDLPSTRHKHLFVIPRVSVIRFKKSRGRERPHVKVEIMQYPDEQRDLVAKVRRNYGAMTSYNQVSGTSILFRPGLDGTSDSDTCDLNNLTTSQRVMTTALKEQTLAGCVAEGYRHPIARPAFILELESAPPGEEEVELDITSLTGQKLTKNFYLILKSPPNLRWRLMSRRVQGWIDIVTNTGIDSDGIRMHPVASRREVMDVTGSGLISWVEYFINPVQAYARVPTATRILLKLPPASKSVQMPLPRGLEPVRRPDASLGKVVLKEHLKKIIHTDCHHGRMTVAVPKQFMEELGLIQDQITLLDSDCVPEANKTHVLLTSSLHGCQTKMLDVDDHRIYSNAIVIHAIQRREGVGEEYGSAYMEGLEGSGSGSGLDMGAYQDDEDFSSWRAVQIEVQCQVPITEAGKEIEEQTDDPPIDFELQLFRDQLYHHERDIPATVTATTQLYVQASVKGFWRYGVVVQDCWFSPYIPPQLGTPRTSQLHRFNVVSEGCSALSTLKEEKNNDHAVRFSLPMESVHQALPDKSRLSLHCQLAACSRTYDQNNPDIPSCVSPRRGLDCTDVRESRGQGGRPQIVTLGPLEMTDKEVDISIHPTNGGTGTSGSSGGSSGQNVSPQERVTIIEGLDSPTVISIAFGTFTIGMVFTGALWFIHTKIGPKKRAMASQASSDTSGDSTPGSMSPISA